MGVTKSKPQIDPALLAEMQGDRKSAESSSGGGGQKYPTYKVEEDGKGHYIRILPGTFGKSKKKFYTMLNQHWLNLKGRNTVFDCLDHHWGEACPVCDHLATLRKQEESLLQERKPDQDELEIVRAQLRRCLFRTAYALNVIDRDEQGNDPVVRLYRAPATVFQAIEAAFLNNGDIIFDPEEGNDFVLTRFQKNKRTNYRCVPDLNACPVDDSRAVIEIILENLIDLDSIPTKPSFEEMLIALDGEMEKVRNDKQDDLDEGRRRGGNSSTGDRENRSPDRGGDKLAEYRSRRPGQSAPRKHDDHLEPRSAPPDDPGREEQQEEATPPRKPSNRPPSRPRRQEPELDPADPADPADPSAEEEVPAKSGVFARLRGLQHGAGDDNTDPTGQD